MHGFLWLLLIVAASAAALPSELRERRAAPLTTLQKWPRDQPIPFYFDAGFIDTDKIVVMNAIQELVQKTCLRFVERNSGNEKAIKISNGKGCFADGGQQEGLVTRVNVNRDEGCMFVPSVQKQLLRALGFGYTEQRSDRDSYVIVNANLMTDSGAAAHAKGECSANNYGIPYDYGSIMHSDAFVDAKQPGVATIVARDSKYNNTMGQRNYLTFYDVKMINKHYGCSDKCPSTSNCQNGGYPNPNACAKCLCNDFFKGDQCETRNHDYSNCGERSSCSSGMAMKVSGNYPKEFEKIVGDWNTWLRYKKMAVFEAPKGKRVRVHLDTLNMTCMPGCYHGAVSIVDNAEGDLGREGKAFCCVSAEKTILVSETNIIGIKIHLPYFRDASFNITPEVL